MYDESGSEISSIIPPENWSSENATDQKSRAQWNELYGKRHHQTLPSFCKTNRSNNATNSSWSGVIARQENNVGNVPFTGAISTWIQPDFDLNVCRGVANPVSYAIWPGIGGDTGSSGLMQNGTDIDFSGNSYAWWEVLNSTDDTHETKLLDFPVSPGDGMVADTQYFPYDGGIGDPAHVTFTFYNHTTNQIENVRLDTALGKPISSFYDGSTAEIIVERPTVSSDTAAPYAALPKPGAGATLFLDGAFNANSGDSEIYNYGLEFYDMNEFATGQSLATVPGPVLNQGGASTWNALWQACGDGQP